MMGKPEVMPGKKSASGQRQLTRFPTQAPMDSREEPDEEEDEENDRDEGDDNNKEDDDGYSE